MPNKMQIFKLSYCYFHFIFLLQAHLQELLTKYISCELVQDVNCDFCTKEKADANSESNTALKSVFTKQLSFGKVSRHFCEIFRLWQKYFRNLLNNFLFLVFYCIHF